MDAYVEDKKHKNAWWFGEKNLFLHQKLIIGDKVMLVATQTRIQETPVWNEIKNWSLDDKRNLITLLYDTMIDEKQDCDMEEETEKYASSFPKDILEMASEYAIKESRAGRGIPHEQAMQLIKEEMGWK